MLIQFNTTALNLFVKFLQLVFFFFFFLDTIVEVSTELHELAQSLVSGGVVLDCIIFSCVSNILTPHVCKLGRQKMSSSTNGQQKLNMNSFLIEFKVVAFLLSTG